MLSGVHSYRSTLDRLTDMNVELRKIPMGFGQNKKKKLVIGVGKKNILFGCPKTGPTC